MIDRLYKRLGEARLELRATGRGAAWLARLSGGPEASLAMPC